MDIRIHDIIGWLQAICYPLGHAAVCGIKLYLLWHFHTPFCPPVASHLLDFPLCEWAGLASIGFGFRGLWAPFALSVCEPLHDFLIFFCRKVWI